MTVLARSELEASPLADLHAIANEVGLEGFRRLRKAELIDSILDETGSGAVPVAPDADVAPDAERDGSGTGSRPRRRRPARARRSRDEDAGGADEASRPLTRTAPRLRQRTRHGRRAAPPQPASRIAWWLICGRRARPHGARGGSAEDAGTPPRSERDGEPAQDPGRIAAGVVEVRATARRSCA